MKCKPVFIVIQGIAFIGDMICDVFGDEDKANAEAERLANIHDPAWPISPECKYARDHYRVDKYEVS